jgi:hypothetical protein
MIYTIKTDLGSRKVQQEKGRMVRRSILDQIFREIQAIRFRLDELERNGLQSKASLEVPESKLMSLPDHLRTTFLVVASKGECSAGSVATQTGRCRAVESNYLNQLCRMGWVDKSKTSRTTMFRPLVIPQ